MIYLIICQNLQCNMCFYISCLYICQTRPNDPCCESTCRLPESHTHHRQLMLLLSRKLKLILPTNGG